MSFVMLSVINAESRCAECCYAKGHYVECLSAECHYALCRGANLTATAWANLVKTFGGMT